VSFELVLGEELPEASGKASRKYTTIIEPATFFVKVDQGSPILSGGPRIDWIPFTGAEKQAMFRLRQEFGEHHQFVFELNNLDQKVQRLVQSVDSQKERAAIRALTCKLIALCGWAQIAIWSQQYARDPDEAPEHANGVLAALKKKGVSTEDLLACTEFEGFGVLMSKLQSDMRIHSTIAKVVDGVDIEVEEED